MPAGWVHCLPACRGLCCRAVYRADLRRSDLSTESRLQQVRGVFIISVVIVGQQLHLYALQLYTFIERQLACDADIRLA